MLTHWPSKLTIFMKPRLSTDEPAGPVLKKNCNQKGHTMNDEIQTPPIPPPQQSMDLDKLFAALAKFQGVFSPPKKSKTNPHLKNKYAPLEEVVESIRTAASPLGLGWSQSPRGRIVDGKPQIHIRTIITHSSGQWMSSESHYPVAAGRNPNQDIVAATTYAKRNELCAAFGMAPDDDDDGESTRGKQPAQPAKKPAAKKKAPPRADNVETRTPLHQYARYLAPAVGLRGASINKFAEKTCGKSAVEMMDTEADAQQFCDALNTYAEEQGCVVMTLAQYMESGNE